MTIWRPMITKDREWEGKTPPVVDHAVLPFQVAAGEFRNCQLWERLIIADELMRALGCCPNDFNEMEALDWLEAREE